MAEVQLTEKMNKAIDKLAEQGLKNRGRLTYDEVGEKLAVECEASADQLDEALRILSERHVEVVKAIAPVKKKEKIIFPIMVTLVVGLILPSSLPLLGMLMLGNLMKESGVVDRLSKTAQNELMNIVSIFLGVTVGATATGANFLTWSTIKIVVMGLAAFCFGTMGGVLLGDLMYVLSGGKINPLIGSAGVSAVPMAARVSQKVGQKENPSNFLLMHAMGPNVAGVIGSAVAAGVLLSILPHV